MEMNFSRRKNVISIEAPYGAIPKGNGYLVTGTFDAQLPLFERICSAGSIR